MTYSYQSIVFCLIYSTILADFNIEPSTALKKNLFFYTMYVCSLAEHWRLTIDITMNVLSYILRKCNRNINIFEIFVNNLEKKFFLLVCEKCVRVRCRSSILSMYYPWLVLFAETFNSWHTNGWTVYWKLRYWHVFRYEHTSTGAQSMFHN